VGEHDGRLFLVLEFVEGGNLGTRLNGRRMPAREAAHLLETLARAMHYAHDCRVIHRDLKPANVLLTLDDTPKIADFGLAKLLDAQGNLTQVGDILGTPSYMAKEQAEGDIGRVTARTDVYALGAILYELLTGRPPFEGSTRQETLAKVRLEGPLPPRSLHADIPLSLENICLKCLKKNPRHRYATAAGLANALEAFLSE
jgi:serine/threonine-protein kinase